MQNEINKKCKNDKNGLVQAKTNLHFILRENRDHLKTEI